MADPKTKIDHPVRATYNVSFDKLTEAVKKYKELKALEKVDSVNLGVACSGANKTDRCNVTWVEIQ